MYKSNSLLWGQTTGCLLRFKFYADQTAINSESLNKTQILTMLNSTIGNVEDYLNQLYQLGENNGHFVGMSKSQFSEFIKEISNKELKNNLAWLQTLTCYKALKDQNFIKEDYQDNGTLKQSDQIKEDRIVDGLNKIYNKSGEIVDLKFYKNMKSINYISHPNLIVVSDTQGWKRGEKFINNKKVNEDPLVSIRLFSRLEGIYGIGRSLRDITLHNTDDDERFTGDFIIIHKKSSDEIQYSKAIIPFKNGKINGKIIELTYYAGLSRKYIDVIDGKIEGKFILYNYDFNNKLESKSVEQVIQNELNGPSVTYVYINNRRNVIRAERNYKDGYLHGDQISFFKDGTKKIIKYDDGTPLPNQ